MTVHVDYSAWHQSPEALRRLALEAPHPRTRERFLALYEIARGSCAARVATATGRHLQSVLAWVHRYNADGPEAVRYARTGGPRPFVWRSRRGSAG